MNKTGIDKKQIKKYIFAGIIGLTIVFIWSNSFKASDASMNDSNGVKELIISFFNNFGIDIKNSFFIEFIRKVGHFSEYFILGAELMLFRIFYLKKGWTSLINTFYIGVITAFLDETVQLIPALGRSAEVKDVWIDIFGVAAAFIVVYAFNKLVRCIKSRKN